MPSAATSPSTGRTRRTLRLDAGKVAAAVPVVLLLAGGVAWAADRDAPAVDAPVAVPADALRLPSGASGQALDDLGSLRVPGGAGPVVAAPPTFGARQASSGGVRIDRSGIPARALDGYRRAEQLLAAGDPSCHLDWALVAAIGRVESAHGSFGGNRLGTDGVARPGIVGIALDGSRGTARITDTDGGRWDGDGRFDRAVGPMQFIPGTWRSVGRRRGRRRHQPAAGRRRRRHRDRCLPVLGVGRPAHLRGPVPRGLPLQPLRRPTSAR